MNKLFMQQAIDISISNVYTKNGGPFGAVVVKDGVVIAQGANQVTTINDPTAHAEVVAIRNACKVLNSFQLQGCELYTSCEPCPMCFGAIYWAHLDKVYFANTKADAAAINFDDQFIYEQLVKSAAHQTIPLVHVVHTNAQEAFELWAQGQDKILY